MNDFFTIRIERHIKEPTHTFSRFFFDGKFKYKGQEYLFTNQFRGVGIEDPIRDTKIHGKTAIPAGVYPLALTNSPKFSGAYFRNEEGLIIQSNERETPAMALEYPTRHELVLINNIPNYSRVLIHWGNTVNDTEGCYIVGSVGGISHRVDVIDSYRTFTSAPNVVLIPSRDATLNDWREFAMEHLLGLTGRTRNLYDIRAVKEIPEKAIRAAVEANSDPSARNIRVAVVVADDKVADAIREVAALALAGTASAMKIFTDINEAEAWLARPLDQIP